MPPSVDDTADPKFKKEKAELAVALAAVVVAAAVVAIVSAGAAAESGCGGCEVLLLLPFALVFVAVAAPFNSKPPNIAKCTPRTEPRNQDRARAKVRLSLLHTRCCRL
jgi:hypothetical protein